ncbi:MAG: ATP-binding cassette domain-containing protein [Proteobacteria bacterium]|nr:ATP-binding cassette domain-containing protein [Pseudomonadota bacterium]
MSDAVLEIADMSVAFGGVEALAGVTFSLHGGELLGLIGPNGAGKTTVMRSITGVVRPDRGVIRLGGQDLGAMPTHMRIRAGLGLSQQLTRPFRSMTVLDNVAFAAGLEWTRRPLRAMFSSDRSAAREEALRLLRLVGIEDAAARMPGVMPLGYLKRLEVARALALKPRLLLLDEPLAGLNHGEAAQLADTIVTLNGQGLPILLIEHNLGEVARICSRLVVLDNGRVLANGPTDTVLADNAVRDVYLGRGGHAAA